MIKVSRPESVENSMEKPTENTADNTAEESVGKPIDNSVEESAEKPAEKPADNSVEESVENPAENKDKDSGKRKKIVRTLGNLLMIVALLFIVRRLWVYRESLTETVNGMVIAVIVISILLYGGVILVQAFAYRILAGAVCGTDLPVKVTVGLYTKSNLYKYLPGNVFHFVGRNQIAEECSVSHADIAFATVLEIAIQCACAVLTGLILSFGFVTDYLRDKTMLVLVVITAGCLAAAALAFLVKKKFHSRWEKVKGLLTGKGRKAVLEVILLHFLIQLCNGILFLVLFQSMGGAVPARLCASVVGIYCFAWLVGFVTPGAPGGLGIREAMLSLFLGSLADPGLIAAAVLLNRIVTVFGDLTGFGYSMLIGRISRS